MRRLLTLMTGWILLLLISLPALAGGVQVSAELNVSNVQIGDTLTLKVIVQGEMNADVPKIQIPDCQVRYYGPSKQFSIVNGLQSQMVSHLYQVIPSKAGTIEVPAIEVIVNGKEYLTEPLTFTVSERGQSVTGSADGALKDYVFLEVIPVRQRMYVNEEISLSVNLYVRRELDLDNIHYPDVLLDNFIVQEFPRPEQRVESRQGEYYKVIPFRTMIRPLSPGTYKLSNVTLQTDVLVQRQNRGYSGFFNDYQVYSANLVAPEIELEVLDFPITGKPSNFAGTVGNYKMNVSVTPDEVKVGEPITIRSRITGYGNFNTVIAPKLVQDSRFKYYAAQIVDDKSGQNNGRNEKVFEQVIIPMTEVETIPALSFSYFDPQLERYVTLREESIPIQVSGEGMVSTQVEDYRSSQKTEEVLGQGILYIKSTPGRFVSVGQTFVSPGLLGYNFVLLLVLGSGILWRVKQGRETAEERRRKAVRAQTQQYLQESEVLLQAGKTTEFYNVLYQTLQNYLKEFYKITITGISDYEAEHLQKAGLKSEILDKIQKFYLTIDEKRFAGAFAGTKDMQQMLECIREIIAEIENGEVA